MLARIYNALHKPTIVLKRVNKLTNAANIVNIICEINEQLHNKQDEFKFLFTIKSQSSFQDIVLRVSPEILQLLHSMHRIYTDLEAIYFQEKVFVKQCQRCFLFNPDHQSHQCTHNICINCGSEGHHQCSKPQHCINCSSCQNPPPPHECNHKPNSPQCP